MLHLYNVPHTWYGCWSTYPFWVEMGMGLSKTHAEGHQVLGKEVLQSFLHRLSRVETPLASRREPERIRDAWRQV